MGCWSDDGGDEQEPRSHYVVQTLMQLMLIPLLQALEYWDDRPVSPSMDFLSKLNLPSASRA